jgi:hypothetical protein
MEEIKKMPRVWGRNEYQMETQEHSLQQLR